MATNHGSGYAPIMGSALDDDDDIGRPLSDRRIKESLVERVWVLGLAQKNSLIHFAHSSCEMSRDRQITVLSLLGNRGH